MSEERNYSRRAFLRTGAGAGVALVVAVHLPLTDAPIPSRSQLDVMAVRIGRAIQETAGAA